MAQEISEIRRKLARVREELTRIEYRVAQVELELAKPSMEERVDALEKEMRSEYPDLRFDRDLLELIGTLPYNPVEKDKEILREAVFERFG